MIQVFLDNLPFNGSVRGGNGVTMSFDGTLVVGPSGELARPGSLDFSVAKFRSNLVKICSNNQHGKSDVDDKHLLVLPSKQTTRCNTT